MPVITIRGKLGSGAPEIGKLVAESLHIDYIDREIIAHNIRRATTNKVLITHGTDRIVHTAQYLAQLGIPDKTVVLTGAMIPYAFGTSSDGFFNLGSALAFVQTLPPGIYVAMNGRFFTWDNVWKNPKTGYFEEINSPE